MHKIFAIFKPSKTLFFICCSFFISNTLVSYFPPSFTKQHSIKKKSYKKVLFILPHLVCGGLDKGFIDMLNFLPRKHSEYDVCILNRGGEFERLLPSKTHIISYNDAVKKTYNAVACYAHWIDPQLWVNKIRAKKYVQWIHADLKTIGGTVLIQNPQKRKGINFFVGVSETATKSMADTSLSLKKKCITIRNCINDTEIIRKSLEPQTDIIPKEGILNIVTVGRFAPEKRLDRLIKVHGQLNRAGISFHWYYVGDGPTRNTLEKLVVAEGLSDKVHFLGSKINPYPYIKAADLFVLGSDSESWGIVITEAMILHRPILSTNVGGAREQISSGINGLIVERDEISLFNGIKRLIEHKEIRDSYVKALENFHYDNETPIKNIQKLLFPKK